MKLSEDGKYIVFRLSEQDGKRGSLKLPHRMAVMNLLEDIEGETENLEYRPFELITLGLPVDVYMKQTERE